MGWFPRTRNVVDEPEQQPYGSRGPAITTPRGAQRSQPRRRNWLGQVQQAGGRALSGLRRAFIDGPHVAENWEVIGATLQDLGGDGRTSYYDDLMANRENQRRYDQQAGWQQQQQQRQQVEWQREDRNQARAELSQLQIAEIIANLPPAEQALARLDPEGYVRGIMRNRYPAPMRSGSRTAAPELPSGFVWED